MDNKIGNYNVLIEGKPLTVETKRVLENNRERVTYILHYARVNDEALETVRVKSDILPPPDFAGVYVKLTVYNNSVYYSLLGYKINEDS
jgi:hypothetical protein